MFQECLNKPIILVNELTLQNQTEAETYKNILGGEITYINIKNRNAEIMYRKPVLLTSNLPIWRFISNDRDPLLNKMYSHMHLATSTVIRKFTSKGLPSTTFWKTAFENIQDVETFFQIPKNENFMQHSDVFRQHL